MGNIIKTIFVILVIPTLLSAIDIKHKDTTFSIGGRIQLENIFGWPEGSHSAKSIPLDSVGENGQLSMNARYSRIWVKAITPTEYGVARTLIETDFAGVKGTEVNTNSHGLRLRHAYTQVGNWTIGQTNSAFNAYVTLDILFTAIDDTFVRQPLVRYSYEGKNISYDISFEQPETTLIDSKGEIITPQDDVLPDIIARVIYYPEWGDVALSLMGRYIVQDHATLSDGTELNSKDTALGWATNFSTRVKTFGLDDIRLGIHYGVGMGRYLAYDAYAAGSISDTGEIKLQESYGANIGYRHRWNKKLRSTISFSYAGTDNNSDGMINLDKVNKNVHSSQINLLWIPIPHSLVGIEYADATRGVESGVESDIKMVNLLFRYDF